MGRSVFRFVVCVGLGSASICLAPSLAGAAEVTIGANVNQVTAESGTCGFEHAAERPCTIVTNIAPPQMMTSPCDGTVTRFRLNGIPRPLDEYSLRVVRHNPEGTYTGTATSAPVRIAVEGVNEYTTDLPISAGESIGIDFLDSTEEHGLRWVGGAGVSAAVLFDFPPDGTSAFPNIPSTNFYYLFNADIACAAAATPAPPTPPPPATPVVAPSNSFSVVAVKKTTLTLMLASAGSVTVTEAKAKTKTAPRGGKAKPRFLKSSSASGGPGLAKLKLALTGAAKAVLRKTGKVKVRASLTFTPTGGTTAVQIHTLTVKRARRGVHP